MDGEWSSDPNISVVATRLLLLRRQALLLRSRVTLWFVDSLMEVCVARRGGICMRLKPARVSRPQDLLKPLPVRGWD